MIDRSPSAISLHTLVVDHLGRPIDCSFDYVNRSFEQQTGLPAGEIVGRRLLEVFPESEPQVVDRCGEVVLTGVPISFETFCSELKRQCRLTVFRHRPMGFAVASSDLDAHEQSEWQSVGVLAGGLAHDFNNILAGLSGQLDLVRFHFESGRSFEVLQWLERTKGTIERAKGLTKQFMNSVRGQPTEWAVIDLALPLKDWVEFALLGSGLEVSVEIAPDLWTCLCNQDQIGRVVLNLLLNARQASAPGGILTLRAFNSPQEQELIAVQVTDHGPGIPSDQLSRIFDPYYSTKPEGTGLGLAVCLSIVKHHGGSITVTSSPVQGTVFTVYLPRATMKKPLGLRL